MQVVSRKRIPNLLRKYRRARGLRQSDVAKILGFCDTSRISRWEKGTCVPSVMNALRLSLLYHVMVEALFTDHLRSLEKEIQRKESEVLRPVNAFGVGEKCAVRNP